MTPERWQAVEEWFDRAVDLPPVEQETLLAEADTTIRNEVRAMLTAHGRTGGGIRTAVSGEARAMAASPEPPWIGRRLGAWRITGTLGRGGMGAVFEAVRDDEQYRQTAAIKLVKREIDSDYARRRFVRERQILAALDHPFIARLLDGGATEDGLPYLVMELIHGRPILSYAREHGLSIESRVRLFRDVLIAVAYAHQKLVVHRDLKPNNILVTSAGTPRLVDFGIARLLDPDLMELAPAETAAPLMTPAYASPEQMRGESAAPASDIYSLGAILYELLSGVQAQSLATASAAEMVDVVCHREPLKPSAVAPERDRRKLSGDLDTIVLTALQKEPARRYPSAEAMAEDLRRHLEGRPIRARADTYAYRAGKFVRRNRVAVIAAAAAVIALAAGVASTVVESHRAQRRFEQVRQLARTLMFDIHDQLLHVEGATAAREALVKTSLAYLNSLAPDAAGDPRLQWELAEAYMRVGDIQDSMHTSNLGQARGAIESWQRAAALVEELERRRPEARVFLLDSQVRYEMGQAYLGLGDQDEARRQIGLGLKAAERMSPLEISTGQNCGSLASGLNLLGDVEMWAGGADAALPHIERAYQVSAHCQTDDARMTKNGLVSSLLRRGDALHALGHMPEAEADYREALRLGRELDHRMYMIWAEEQLANVLGADRLANLGRPGEAAERLRNALVAIQAQMEKDRRDSKVRAEYVRATVMYANLLRTSNAAESEQWAARAVESVETSSAENAGDPVWEELSASAAGALGASQARLGRADAEALLRRSVRQWESLSAQAARQLSWRISLALSRVDLGDLLLKRDRGAAMDLYRQAAAALETTNSSAARHEGLKRLRQLAEARMLQSRN